MRKLSDRELDLLVNGANSLASSWRLKALLRTEPYCEKVGKRLEK